MTCFPRSARVAAAACTALAALAATPAAQALPFVAEASIFSIGVVGYTGEEGAYVPTGDPVFVPARVSFRGDSDGVYIDRAGRTRAPISSISFEFVVEETLTSPLTLDLDAGDAFAAFDPIASTITLLADVPGDGSSGLIPLAFVAGLFPTEFAFDSDLPETILTAGVRSEFNDAYLPLPMSVPGSPVTALGLGGFGGIALLRAMAADELGVEGYATGPVAFGFAASPVPAPAALPLAAMAMGALAFVARRRRAA